MIGSTLGINTKIGSLVLVFMLSFLVFFGVAMLTLDKLKVNGPIYTDIVANKDLIADILPPPAYILESYLVALEMLGATDKADLAADVQRMHTLKTEYLARHKYWDDHLEEGPLKTELIEKSYTPAMAFYDAIDTKFIPVLQNETTKAAASEIAYGTLRTLYAEHRAAIDTAVGQSATRIALSEKNAVAQVKSKTAILIILGVCGILFSALAAFVIVRGITKPFDVDIDELNTLSKQMSATSHQMAATAEETATQANLVSAGAEQVSMGVSTVATAVEEMGASIREISQNAAEAARVATGAVHAAESTSKVMGELSESSSEIGKVVNVITAIAEQTKLLALNATIEAARAGEAGKGFAVVANEVKDLAKETAKATQEIGDKIATIQSAANASVESIASILSVINSINALQMTIASSVEEQTATTNEVSRNITEIAEGSSEIANNISKVAQASQDTSAAASETLLVGNQLPKIADHLVSIITGSKK